LAAEPGHRGATMDAVRLLIELEDYQPAVNRAKAAAQAHQGDREFATVRLGRGARGAGRGARGAGRGARGAGRGARGAGRPHFSTPPSNPQLYHEAEKRLKMSLRKDYYKILGVPKDADLRVIKKGYKRLAVQYHPDKAPASERAAFEDKFKEVRGGEAGVWGMVGRRAPPGRWEQGHACARGGAGSAPPLPHAHQPGARAVRPPVAPGKPSGPPICPRPRPPVPTAPPPFPPPRQVAEAYEVLKDDEKRAAYDRGDDLEQGGGGGGGGFHPFHGGGGGGGWTFTFNM
jgi:hypothetical protein